MNFTGFASTPTQTATVPLPISSLNKKQPRNYDHFIDPYIRRYHITKIAIKSLSYGLITYITKSIV